MLHYHFGNASLFFLICINFNSAYYKLKPVLLQTNLFREKILQS